MNRPFLFRRCLMLATATLVLGCGGSMSEITGSYTAASFEKLISQDKLILVKFGSSSCGPCNRLDDELAAIEADPPKGLEVHYLSVGSNQDLARKLDIRGIPRMMLFRNGRKVGFQDQNRIRSWVNSLGGSIGDVHSNPFAMDVTQHDESSPIIR